MRHTLTQQLADIHAKIDPTRIARVEAFVAQALSRVAARIARLEVARGITPTTQRRPPGRQKLSDDDVRAIRASTETAAVLSVRYGITPVYVYMLRARRARASVPPAPPSPDTLAPADEPVQLPLQVEPGAG
jgi:hypothetical protein